MIGERHEKTAKYPSKERKEDDSRKCDNEGQWRVEDRRSQAKENILAKGEWRRKREKEERKTSRMQRTMQEGGVTTTVGRTGCNRA